MPPKSRRDASYILHRLPVPASFGGICCGFWGPIWSWRAYVCDFVTRWHEISTYFPRQKWKIDVELLLHLKNKRSEWSLNKKKNRRSKKFLQFRINRDKIFPRIICEIIKERIEIRNVYMFKIFKNTENV